MNPPGEPNITALVITLVFTGVFMMYLIGLGLLIIMKELKQYWFTDRIYTFIDIITGAHYSEHGYYYGQHQREKDRT